ncbi:hypothetical protein BH23BAC3_BH23BAC3_36070 [soil metagenome]
MNYQEMVDALISMNEQQRRMALKAHWEVAFSDSFIAYVQGQLEEGRKLVNGGSDIENIIAGVNPELVDVLRSYGAQHLNNLHQVWTCMSVVYQDLQRQSERQGHTGGMVKPRKSQGNAEREIRQQCNPLLPVWLTGRGPGVMQRVPVHTAELGAG